MTDTATAAATDSSAAPSPAETRAVVQRRLIGLAVLMLIVFGLSLLLRARTDTTEKLQSVVIPLNGSIITNPVDQPSPVLGQEPAEPVPELVPVPVAARPVLTAEPQAKPITSKPESVPKAAAVAPAPKPQPALAVAKPVPAKPPAKALIEPPAVAALKPGLQPRWFVNVGAYKDPIATRAIANRVKLAGFNVETVAVTAAGERLNRVRAGPFSKKDAAESARVTLIVEGLTKAVTVSEK